MSVIDLYSEYVNPGKVTVVRWCRYLAEHPNSGANPENLAQKTWLEADEEKQQAKAQQAREEKERLRARYEEKARLEYEASLARDARAQRREIMDDYHSTNATVVGEEGAGVGGGGGEPRRAGRRRERKQRKKAREAEEEARRQIELQHQQLAEAEQVHA
eukprot:COSAG05_NODE_4664_length_1419_cov_11.303788_2_plen_160_part_00